MGNARLNRTKKTTAKKASLFQVNDRNEVSHGKNAETMHAVSLCQFAIL